MVPGVQVARIDANKWAVTRPGLQRPFRQQTAGAHGRAQRVHAASFRACSGRCRTRCWRTSSASRSSAVREPTLWGANAVNGVINIITKNAAGHPGGCSRSGAVEPRSAVSAACAMADRSETTAITGSTPSISTAMRPWISAETVRPPTTGTCSGPAFAAIGLLQAGTISPLQGDFTMAGPASPFLTPRFSPPYENRLDDETNLGGGNLLTRWKRSFSPVSDVTLQLYYDRTHYDDAIIGEKRRHPGFRLSTPLSARENGRKSCGVSDTAIRKTPSRMNP